MKKIADISKFEALGGVQNAKSDISVFNGLDYRLMGKHSFSRPLPIDGEEIMTVYDDNDRRKVGEFGFEQPNYGEDAYTIFYHGLDSDRYIHFVDEPLSYEDAYDEFVNTVVEEVDNLDLDEATIEDLEDYLSMIGREER